MQGPCQILTLTLASGWFFQLRIRHSTVLAALARGICLCRTDMNPSVRPHWLQKDHWRRTNSDCPWSGGEMLAVIPL